MDSVAKEYGRLPVSPSTGINNYVASSELGKKQSKNNLHVNKPNSIGRLMDQLLCFCIDNNIVIGNGVVFTE